MKRLENGTHFVEISTDGKVVISTTGKLGGKPKTTRTAKHDRRIAATAKLQLAAQYLADGYHVVHMPPSAQPRNATLEAAIRANRDDPAPYLVYADWLQGQGSALGELIVLEHRKRTEAAAELRAKLGVPDEDLATVAWRWGLWRSLHVNNIDHQNEAFDGIALVRPLFAATVCGVLEELRIGILRWDHDHRDVPALIAEAAQHAWAPELRVLHVGDVDRDIDMAHHVIGEVGAAISRAFPKLVELRLRSGEQSWRGEGETFGLDGLELPELASLTVETCALTADRLAAVLDARLPSLTRLELWFGSERDAPPAQLADLSPLLSGARHPRVRHLGLRNAEIADDLARTVPISPIAERLEVLDLSMGTLGDGGARELVARRDRFPRLTRLVVDDNFLTPAGLAALRGAYAGVEVVSTDQKAPFDDDERYVSIAE